MFSTCWLPPKCQVTKQKQLESKPLEGFSSLLRRMTLNFASWSGGWVEFSHRNTACLLKKINNFICHMLMIKISEIPQSDSTQPLNNSKANKLGVERKHMISNLRGSSHTWDSPPGDPWWVTPIPSHFIPKAGLQHPIQLLEVLESVSLSPYHLL